MREPGASHIDLPVAGNSIVGPGGVDLAVRHREPLIVSVLEQRETKTSVVQAVSGLQGSPRPCGQKRQIQELRAHSGVGDESGRFEAPTRVGSLGLEPPSARTRDARRRAKQRLDGAPGIERRAVLDHGSIARRAGKDGKPPIGLRIYGPGEKGSREKTALHGRESRTRAPGSPYGTLKEFSRSMPRRRIALPGW